MDALHIGLLVSLVAILMYIFFLQPQPTQTIIKEVEVEPPVYPYWMYYGLPSTWQRTIPSYWFYDVPYYGPITGGSYKPWGPHNYHKYLPPQGNGSRLGYTGVAVGGGGGGH